MSSKRVSKAHSQLAGQLLDGSATPIYLVDQDRRIVFLNEACGRWLGLNDQSLLGEQADFHSRPDVDPPAGLAAALCPPPEAFLGRFAFARLVAPGDTAAPRTAACVPLEDAEGQSSGVLVVVLATACPSSSTLQDLSAASRAHEWLSRFHAAQRERFGVESLIGDNPDLVRARAQLQCAIQTAANVLVIGPPGSGRAQITRILVAQGSAENVPSVTLNCQDLDEAQLQSTLEWIAQSATAQRSKPILVMLNLEQLHPDLQFWLATALNRELHLRLLSTAAPSLRELMERGMFRHDLACRLSTLTIELPALMLRLDDLPLLVQSFVESENSVGQKQLAGVSDEVLEQLWLYSWPGNTAELEAVIREAHDRAEGPLIEREDLPAHFTHVTDARARPRPEEATIELDAFLAEIELELIQRALLQAQGNKTKAAQLLGLNRARFYRRLNQLGLLSDAELRREEDRPN